MIENYFQHLFSESGRWWISIEREVFKPLTEEDTREFKRPSGGEEIWIIIGVGKGQSSGPGWLYPWFLLEVVKFVWADMLNLFHEFYSCWTSVRTLNA